MTVGRTDRRTDGGDCNIPDAFFYKKRGDNKNATFDRNIPCGLRFMSIYTNLPLPA